MSQSPIKVPDETRDQLRYASPLLEKSQSEIVRTAVNEYMTRHQADIERGLERARQALRAGDAEAIAYLLDETPEAVHRVTGRRAATSEDRGGRSRGAARRDRSASPSRV